MSKHRKNPRRAAKPQPKPSPSERPARRWLVPTFLLAAVTVVVVMLQSRNRKPASPNVTRSNSNAAATPNIRPTADAETNAPPLPVMEANQSVVVTHDLDYGAGRPGLAEILSDIERRHQPDDGVGRTFAILEAFNGEVQSDGQMRVSLRLSMEKPGMGEIILRKTGQSLWKSRISPAAHPSSFAAGSLTILFDNGDGKSFTVDGSAGPPSIFEALLKEPGIPVAQAWPDGEVRTLKFIYSACGCPIEVKCRREGNRTVRTEPKSQVIFPDDPTAIGFIAPLMRWL